MTRFASTSYVPTWQVLFEFNKLEGVDMLDTMCKNWRRVCEQMQNEGVEMSEYEQKKKAILKIEKNVNYWKIAYPVTITEVGLK